MSRTVIALPLDLGPNPDRIERVLARRRSHAAGPHADRRRPRGGRQGARMALRREAEGWSGAS
jgi:hypothetical protein